MLLPNDRASGLVVAGGIANPGGGEVVLQHIDEPSAASVPRTLPVTRPFAIGAAGGSLEITGLRVYRDLFYLHPWGHNADWEMTGKLADDEIFVLGDNRNSSTDSRKFGPIEENTIVDAPEHGIDVGLSGLGTITGNTVCGSESSIQVDEAAEVLGLFVHDIVGFGRAA